ncbi:hypothetical protein EJ08DRAFT_644594 [Tothia fuscella]|uniref:cysteine--tRNA ligase n=1 Tax=Tothia fuscella TaxID=1048955 RepID=A0A9P4P2H0_9PEZI|nr:hypothetical protein EJ08DRAFT_644594 [Tothia fuscella]
MATARQQPQWVRPESAPGVQLPPLRIYNSLTRQKNDFVPVDSKGKKVTWYACGPTVYDDSHLGHARNYISTDIIRRIMKDYFKFDVTFVMNITDVDDKIILRGREQHLFRQFTEKHTKLDDTVVSTAHAAFDHYMKKNLPLIPADTAPAEYLTEVTRAYSRVTAGRALEGDGPPGDHEAKIKMHIKTASSAAEALQLAKATGIVIPLDQFYAKSEDTLVKYLDSLYGMSIDASDHTVFTKLTKQFEHRFFEDMGALNMLYPDVLTRVTEFGPQIVDFVVKIVKNGFAYATTDGDVYFDIQAFENGGLPYARLEPWNRGNKALQADGEGALTAKSSKKRSEADFAVWKHSKPGEPSWPSPWGPGRPGWHIECSVMASETLGKTMDIHSGGIDLAFPHHDNELAQSEAYWSEPAHNCSKHGGSQWVNYFMHMGHLSIQGFKMSKSLKNFTTVREVLSRGDWTPRGLRVVFLLGGWKEGVEVTDELVKAGLAWEDKVQNFMLKAKDLDMSAIVTNGSSETNTEHKNDTLREKLTQAQKTMDEALCDSFNTPVAMRTISDLISEYNSLPPANLNRETVLDTARWVTKIVTIFGLDGIADPNDTSRIGWTGVEIPSPAQPYIYPLSHLRDEVRKQARSTDISYTNIKNLAVHTSPTTIKPTEESEPYAKAFTHFQDSVKSLAEEEAPAKDLLGLCDQLRDTHLWNLGIYLEDREPPLGAMIRPVDKQLVLARNEKEEREKSKLEAKVKREAEEAEKKRQADERAKVSHLDMFKTSGEYSVWDGEGLPLKDREGVEVSKAKGKKLRKDWERQKKLHEAWVKAQEGGGV